MSTGSVRRTFSFACILVALAGGSAEAGPETALREFAGGQVKKGVRTIGMGGDGATTGNYALVYKDAGGAIFDEGIAHFGDTGNTFTEGVLAGEVNVPIGGQLTFYVQHGEWFAQGCAAITALIVLFFLGKFILRRFGRRKMAGARDHAG